MIRYDDSIVRAARRLYADGLGYRAIGLRLEVPTHTVRDWIKGRRDLGDGYTPPTGRAAGRPHGCIDSVKRRARYDFAIGDVVTGLRLLAETTRRDDPFWRDRTIPSQRIGYRYVCVECGHEGEIGHRSLCERIRSGRTVCRACSGLKEHAAKRRGTTTPKDDALAIALGAWR